MIAVELEVFVRQLEGTAWRRWLQHLLEKYSMVGVGD
jgi:hypothetical protein